MLSCLLLGAALSLGQTESPDKAVEVQPAPTPTVQAPDRWELMKALQGTWYGSLLDDNRLRLYGWSDMTYTASSDRVSNLPMGLTTSPTTSWFSRVGCALSAAWSPAAPARRRLAFAPTPSWAPTTASQWTAACSTGN